jgi:hypothetical protein
MPNHFHLLLYVDIMEGGRLPSGQMQVLERKIGTLQSSYTRAINNQEKKTGSLFQPKCKVIMLSELHAFTCFHYIHQNPLKAGLCSKFEDWNFSSFKEYMEDGDGSVCKRAPAYDLLRIPKNPEEFVTHSLSTVVNEDVLLKIK